MREFVLTGHTAPTEPGFSLDDLPGAGRIDVLCRAVSAAAFTSHGIREAVRVHLVLQDTYTITVDTRSLRTARPDERSIAGLIDTALAATDDAIGHQPATPVPGIELRTHGLEPTLTDRLNSDPVYVLQEDGTPIDTVSVPDEAGFVLADHENFTPSERDCFADHSVETVRFGPTVVHTDHAVTIAHHWLDTQGYTRF